MKICNIINFKALDRLRLGLLGAVLAILAGMIVGCAHTKTEEPTMSEADALEIDQLLQAIGQTNVPVQTSLLAEAQAFYDAGDYRGALRECVELSRFNPDMPGLGALRDKTVAALQQQQAERFASRSISTEKGLALDAARKWDMPDTYGMVRQVEPEKIENTSTDAQMVKVLQKPVTIHLKNAELSTFLDIIAQDPDINVIADKSLSAKGGIDVEVDEVPLGEVFDYISRNFGVLFNLGRNIIWVTAADPNKAPAMETRVFHLEKGVGLLGSDWGNNEEMADQVGMLATKATIPSEKPTSLETMISKFVPQPTGAELYFDRSINILLAKNTQQNLRLIEEIIRIIDRTPIQVLIEARFVEARISDLSELGVEWTAVDDIVTTWSSTPIIKAGSQTVFDPYVNPTAGDVINPLAPVGAFTSDKTGLTLPTAEQGLNLTFTGTLNGAQLEALLHALEISGNGKTLSVPRVTTVNNSPAKLRNGQDFYYYKQFKAQAFSLLDANGKTYNASALMPDGSPTKEELGITLVAVPSVGADMKTINLLLMPTISEFKGYQSYTAGAGSNAVQQVEVKLPTFSRQEIQTRVSVESGQTVAMGGLISTQSQKTIHRIPILGSLPWIGVLFRNTVNSEEVKNLIIFVTATVISERGESLVAYPPSASDETSQITGVQPASAGME